jgi:hypothetical protein
MGITEDLSQLSEALLKIASYAEIWYAIIFLVCVRIWSKIVIPD